MKTGVLYISYTGILEPLGQSQVLAYQERLAAGYEVHLLSFERRQDWSHAERREALEARMRGAGVHWHPLRYHKRFSLLSTLWDILRGVLAGVRLVRRHRLSIVHARSYVPSVMALAIKRITGASYIFDMRGFWADERVDGGLWPERGRMYRMAKWFERRFLLGADHVVSLTRAAIVTMREFPYLQGRMPPCTVIPTCTDLARFRPLPVAKSGSLTLGYVGSAGTWYLFDEVATCFRELLERRPDARLLVVNRDEHEHVRARLAAAGVPEQAYELTRAEHGDIPALMARMHAGIFFIRPVFSKQASAPTKLGEFLGCGVPCLSNAGVGDMAEILEGERVGVALADFSPATLDEGIRRLLELVADPDAPPRCVAAARRHFALEEGVSRYRRIYAGLGKEGPDAIAAV